MPSPTRRSAIAAIQKLGACLVFPHDNRPEPVSLWSHFHPRTAMRWEWDEGGDGRVPVLWHLRSELSESGEVAYAKWYRGRATLLSLPVLSAFTRLLAPDEDVGLGPEARGLYQCFEENSPISTKEVKEAADLRGKANERAFERGMKELWTRLLVVGHGERADGAFPSLCIGATKWLHEQAWRDGRALTPDAARAIVERTFAPKNPFRVELEKLVAKRRG